MSTTYNGCFACGTDNPIGLKLQFTLIDDTYVAQFVAASHYQSYDNMLHGGIIATLLDEAMANYVLYLENRQAVTAKLEVRYRHQAPIGTPLRVQAKLIRKKAHMYEMKGELYQVQDDILLAEATAKVLLV